MPSHVTIFLPAAYRGGTLRVTISIARMIKLGSERAGKPCGVRVCVCANVYNMDADFCDLHADGIEVREVDWGVVEKDEVSNILGFLGRDVHLQYEEYFLAEDAVNNSIDSDLWLVISDRLTRPLAPLRPHVVFSTDYIQRYVPEIFDRPTPGDFDLNYLRAVRNADAVFVTTPRTGDDVVSYVGVPRNRIHLAPMDFDPTPLKIKRKPPKAKRPYFVWATNPTPHKNHLRAFQAISRYYEELDGKLDVKITGFNARWFDPEFNGFSPEPHVLKVRSFIEGNPSLEGRIEYLGEASDETYAKTIAASEFMWHATITDNGTFAVAEAAYLGRASLASDYPQMRYISDRFSLPTMFFNAKNVREMAAALKKMEREAVERRDRLPGKDDLLNHSWQSYAKEYWALIEKVAA